MPEQHALATAVMLALLLLATSLPSDHPKR
jgi:hypothetical protein